MSVARQLWLGVRALGSWPIWFFFHEPATPWVPIAFYSPIGIACLVWSLLGERPALWAFLVLPPAGLLLWSFLEYAFHSVGFHWPTQSPRWQALQASHHSHHDVPNDPSRMVVRLSFTLPLALVIFGILTLALGTKPAALVMVGLILGYLAYEVVHYRVHIGRGPRWFRPLVRHHLYHHYKDAARCYGVTSPLWDWVFRTGRPPKKQRAAPVLARGPVSTQG